MNPAAGLGDFALVYTEEMVVKPNRCFTSDQLCSRVAFTFTARLLTASTTGIKR